MGYLFITFHHWSFLSTKRHGVISGWEKYNSDFIERNLNVRSFWYIYKLLQFYPLKFKHFSFCFKEKKQGADVIVFTRMMMTIFCYINKLQGKPVSVFLEDLQKQLYLNNWLQIIKNRCRLPFLRLVDQILAIGSYLF